MERLVLASSSPRRKEILAMLGIPFHSIHPDIDESICDHLPPGERVLALAILKAEAGFSLFESQKLKEGRFILAADTLVALRRKGSWKVIGKPNNREEAKSMLESIQGRLQHVFTGLCLLDAKDYTKRKGMSHSTVRFAPMSEIEIRDYLSREEWLGAAGAYKVQGWGSAFIERLSGSPTGVMGLPIHELYDILRQAGLAYSRQGISVPAHRE